MGFLRRQLSMFAPLSINRRGLSFLGTLAFMTAFFGARVFAILNPTVVVAQGSIHFHHFWYGLGMVTLAGWLGIAFNRPRLVRTYAIIFGLGAGLIGDEVGLLLTFGDYQSSLTTDFFVGVIGFIILASTLVRYRKIVMKDVTHTSWNERLIYIGTTFEGTPFAPTSAIESLAAATIYVLAVDVFLSGVIGGAILGLIFARLHDRYLRSSSLRTRGIIFGLILWILLSLSSFGSEFGLLYDTISVIIGLVAYLAYGILLAQFFPRFKRNIQYTRKESDGQQAIPAGKA